MANEITITAQIKCLNGTFNFPLSGVSQLQPNQTTPGGGSPGEISAITTGQGTLVDLSTLASSGAGGWVLCRNEDPTNFVSFGPDNAGNLVKLGEMLPGEPALFRLSRSQTKFRFLADTAACRVSVQILNP